MNIYYINGKFVPSDKAFIHANDLAVLRGFGVFDFLRTYNGKPFYLTHHVRRLKNSAELLGIPFLWKTDEVCSLVYQTLEKNDHAESNVRIMITGGISMDSITPGDDPSLLIMVILFLLCPKNGMKKALK